MLTNNEWLFLAAYVAGGAVVGFIIKKILFPILAKAAAKTSWQSDDLIIDTVRKWVLTWFIATGLYIGLRNAAVQPKYDKMLEHGIIIFFIFSVTVIAAKIIAGMMRIKATGSDTVIPSSSIISNIVKVIIYCIGILIILQTLGISITPVLTALGVGGLAVALALQDTLSNLFAGIQIIASAKINPGDFVVLDSGQEGFVQDVTWRNTTIKTTANNIIILPNSKLANLIVSNFTLGEKEMGFVVDFGVSYSSDLEQVERVTKEVITQTLENTEGGVKGFEPLIRFINFADSSITVRAILRVQDYIYQFPVRSQFIKNLHKRFNQEGINIPFPIRTIHMKN
jgi:small-conductance mechanosensitive channel